MGSPQIDHDRFFKELLSNFFLEFLDLFFPELTATVQRDSLDLLNQELYADLLTGEAYRADLIVKCRQLDTPADAFFLVHVEHQSTAPTAFGERFFGYYAGIYNKHRVPVYPIVVYSHSEPYKQQPDRFCINFPDGPVLTFDYRVVQLNRLPWRRFIDNHNPVACALMSKMDIAPVDRPLVKLECLRLLVTLKLNPAKSALIGRFIDGYLRLTAEETQRFREALKEARTHPEVEETVLDYVTSWEEKGIEIGMERGLQQALRDVLLDILATRFGPLSPSVVAQIESITNVDELRRLTHEAITVPTLDSLKFPG